MRMFAGSPFFAPPSIAREARSDGSWIVRSRDPLAPYARSVGVQLAYWAERRGDAVFLGERTTDGWRTITYAEMFERSRRVAAGLLALGLNGDTPLAILSPASIVHATVSLAAQLVGIPVAPISPAYGTQVTDLRRFEFVLAALRPGLVFVEDADAFRAALATIDPAIPIVVGRGTAPRARTLASITASSAGDDVDAAHRAVGPDHIAKILFTSGSTGEPKGVINTHLMLCSNQQSIAQVWPFLDHTEIVLVDWLPWHHTFGGNYNFNLALFHGGSLYIDDGRPLPGQFERTIDALGTHRPTLHFNVPRGHTLLVDALRADETFAERFFSRLNVIGNAAAALPRTTWDALRLLAARYGSPNLAITGSWGLTETAPTATLVHDQLRDPADIGLPTPGTELLLTPYEHKYEVRVRGPLVTPGYWRRADLTAAAFDAEGFYRTGDALRFTDPADAACGLLFDGRIAENFKLTTGTWVDAGAVRVAVLAALAPLVEDVVVAGEDRDELGVLAFFGTRSYITDEADDERRAAIRASLEAYNALNPGSSVRIGRLLLVAASLSIGDGEVTDKGSVNQMRVRQRYRAAVDRLFASGERHDVIIPRA